MCSQPNGEMCVELFNHVHVSRVSPTAVLETLFEVNSLDDQEKHHLALLKKIAAGATTITKAEGAALMDELVQLGYVAVLENDFFGERIFLDVQIMPSGEARLVSGIFNSDK
jgi:truncated hemoglobin YjbI